MVQKIPIRDAQAAHCRPYGSASHTTGSPGPLFTCAACLGSLAHRPDTSGVSRRPLLAAKQPLHPVCQLSRLIGLGKESLHDPFVEHAFDCGA